MTETTEILAQILGATDGIWYPLTRWTRPTPSNTYCARRDYATTGAAWQSGAAGDTAARKRVQRALEALVQAGDVVASKPRGAKTLYVKLSSTAENRIRRLAGVPGALSAFISAKEIARHTRRKPKLMQHRWASEYKLMQHADGPNDVALPEAKIVRRMMLWGLSRELIVAHSDIHGRIYYMLPPAGWAWIEDEPPEDDENNDQYDDEVNRVYFQHLNSTLMRLSTMQPIDSRELGGLPLPVHQVGMKL
jgi:hypothetical protein